MELCQASRPWDVGVPRTGRQVPSGKGWALALLYLSAIADGAPDIVGAVFGRGLVMASEREPGCGFSLVRGGKEWSGVVVLVMIGGGVELAAARSPNQTKATINPANPANG